MSLVILSDQLPIVALVSRYLANKLMGVGPIRKRTAALDVRSEDRKSTCGISAGFPALSPTFGQITQLILTSSPLGRGRSRSTFYPLSDGISTHYRRITKSCFRICSTCMSRS